jgi:hypothetical protein
MTKHLRECTSICSDAGLTVLSIYHAGKHLKIVCREGTIACGCTPSDWRWTRKLRAHARRLARVSMSN